MPLRELWMDYLSSFSTQDFRARIITTPHFTDEEKKAEVG